ncbi:MAG: DUF4373 domain-containing protein [Nitrososphaeraceae archaeon]|nr:DUF4373 domain-containing protein [Nitrososphaeraceae archaeon]
MTKTGADYFPHKRGHRNESKIRRLRKELQCDGYGIYMMVLEVLIEQVDFRYPMDDIDLLADEFNTSVQKVRTVICNYGLFQVDEKQMFFSLEQQESMQEYIEKSERARFAAKVRWDNAKRLAIDNQCEENANAMQMHNKCNADKNAKRKEKKRKEKKEDSSIGKIRSSFSKPSHEEVVEYFSERLEPNAENSLHPAKFFDYYEANGWKVGKNPMKDWKAAIRNWITNINNFSNNGNRTNQPSNKRDSLAGFKSAVKSAEVAYAAVAAGARDAGSIEDEIYGTALF